MSSQAPVPVGKPVFLPGLAPVLTETARSHPADTDLLRQMLEKLSMPWLASLSAGRPVGSSLLTPGGYPLEFNFSTGHSNLCYTAEPGLPDDPPAVKWAHIDRLVPGFDRRQHAELDLLVAQSGQRFGCWISFRHLPGGLAAKIYQEVTTAAAPAIAAILHATLPAIKKADLLPLLFGVFPGRKKTVEYYCGIRNSSLGVLQELVNQTGTGWQLPFLRHCLSDLAAESQATIFDRLRLGASFRFDETGQPSLTIFVNAPQLFATNLRARTALLALAGQLNAPMALYERLTAEDATAAAGSFAYSIISFKLEPTGGLEMGFGWHPAISGMPA